MGTEGPKIRAISWIALATIACAAIAVTIIIMPLNSTRVKVPFGQSPVIASSTERAEQTIYEYGKAARLCTDCDPFETTGRSVTLSYPANGLLYYTYRKEANVDEIGLRPQVTRQ